MIWFSAGEGEGVELPASAAAELRTDVQAHAQPRESTAEPLAGSGRRRQTPQGGITQRYSTLGPQSLLLRGFTIK